MKHASYNDKSRPNLAKALDEKREALRRFRFGGAGSKTRNTKEGRNLRKEIARILTVLNRK